jgi:hypothetical protein
MRRGLGFIRSFSARRTINWTPDFMGFGNQLYLWCWAHAGASKGDPRHRLVLLTPKMRPWADLVPEFATQHLIDPHSVKLWDHREHYWANPLAHCGDPRGYTNGSRAAFVRDVLIGSPLLSGIANHPLNSSAILTVNVRRGDYYSNPHFRREHAMDVRAYVLAAAAATVAKDGAVERVHVISDDLAWCHRELSTDLGELTGSPVTFALAADSPATNFRDICAAGRLVITNSTFSIWGAGISTVLHGENRAKVWAPAFFQRRYGPGRCYEYDAEWSFIDHLPGGWQPHWLS